MVGLYGQTLGLAFFKCYRGSITKPIFISIFHDMLRSLIEKGLQLSKVVIVIDNAPSHSRLEENISHEFKEVNIVRMAPYSAPLSPLEFFWSCLKQACKLSLSQQFHELVAEPRGITQMEHRLRFLESIVESASRHCNTIERAIGFYNHVQGKYSVCLSGEPLIY